MTEQTPLLLTLGWLLHLLTFALVAVHCLRAPRRHPSATILWLFIAWSVPAFGALAYLAFGVDRVRYRGFQKSLSDERLLTARRQTAAVPRAYWHDLSSAPSETGLQRAFNRTFDALIPDHPALAGNRLVPLVSGDEAFPRMLEAVRGARRHIHLQSFIIGNDSAGRALMKELAAKAAEGVEVRLLYDRFGSTWAVFGGLFRKYRRTPNLQIAGWTQANVLKRQFQINLRNHRKALITDGKKAFFGGINIHQENVTRNGVPPIRDYHFEAEGPIVQELQYAFLRDWHFITDEEPDRLLTEDYFPHAEPAGSVTARLINSGPSTVEDVAIEAFFNSIVLAEKQILAVTPYFVPTTDILRALRSAALRGVDVRLIVPQINNHRYAGLAGQALYEELLLAGVRIYERRPPFMHAKALIVDGEFALIGTANIDVRSLHLNYETSAAVYSTAFADAMKNIIHEEISCSDEILLTEWRRRPFGRRLLENLCSLMAPVL